MNPGGNYTKSIREMKGYKVQYKNSNFSGKRIELDGKYFNHCRFKDCIIVLEKGDTDIAGSSFENCKLLLKGNAYIIGKIINLFTGKSPLKVLDFDEPLFEKTRTNGISRKGVSVKKHE
jgi:hypothetical protein